MYTIDMDPAKALIRVRLGGMMTVEEVGLYVADLSRAFLLHRMRAGYIMLIDVSTSVIQSQEVIAALIGHIAAFPKARRIAMVVGDSLARMQVRRVMTQDYTRAFADAGEAEAWLLGADGDAVTAVQPCPVLVVR